MRTLHILKMLTAHLMGALYVFTGVTHFTNAEFFISIVPDYLPWHEALVYISGVAEILCGVLVIIPRTRVLGAWLTIALLVAVFPANVNTALHPEQFDFASPIGHYIRLPIQGLLILWAYWYTRPDQTRSEPAIDR